jgi:hypothetical protein
VSVVTEDWRFRMVVPPRNDFPGLPLTPAARQVANDWDPARDEAAGNECAYYGAGAIMRIPGRLRISWDDAQTLEIETDAGRQTRVLEFGAEPEPPAEAAWQGTTTAEWELHSAGFRAPPTNGTIKAVTTNMRPGYLRMNGVPYSENAVLTEYYDRLVQHDGTEWLVVLSILEDPTYFATPVITSTNFRRQSDRSGWSPTGCEVPEVPDVAAPAGGG